MHSTTAAVNEIGKVAATGKAIEPIEKDPAGTTGFENGPDVAKLHVAFPAANVQMIPVAPGHGAAAGANVGVAVNAD